MSRELLLAREHKQSMGMILISNEAFFGVRIRLSAERIFVVKRGQTLCDAPAAFVPLAL